MEATERGAIEKGLRVLWIIWAAMIVSLALSESIGVYGLVLFLIGDSFQTLYIFIGISVVAMFFYRPKREDLETLATAIHTKSAPPPEL